MRCLGRAHCGRLGRSSTLGEALTADEDEQERRDGAEAEDSHLEEIGGGRGG